MLNSTSVGIAVLVYLHLCIYSTANTAFLYSVLKKLRKENMDFLVNKDIKDKVAVEYCRKSTESEDRQAFSLEDQHDVNKKVAENYGVRLKKTYSESKSAKMRGRPFFNEMVNGVESGKYQVIICWALNRLARNSVDGAMLIEMMDLKKLHAIVTPGKVFYNSSDDKLLLQIEFGLAKKYSDDLSPNVMRGMTSKLKRGWYPGMAKPGYLNKKEKGEIIHVIDPDRFPLIRKAMLMYIEGSNVDHILEILNNDWAYRTVATVKTGNKPLSRSSFYRMLRDPFYYGKIVWNNEESDLDASVPRLITEDEFWLIQDRLGAKGFPRPQKHKDIPYKGVIKCAVCGSSVIIYQKDKRLADGTMKSYYFARCSSKKGCKQPPLSVSKLEIQLNNILNQINISKDFYEWFIKWLKKDHELESTNSEFVLDRIDAQIELQIKRKNRLLDMRIDGELQDEDYKEKKNTIDDEIRRLEKERHNVNYNTDNWINRAEKRLDYALYAVDKLEHGDYIEKTSVLANLGTNFTLNNGILCYDLDSVLNIFKNNHEVVNDTLERFELNDIGLPTANVEAFDSVISTWLGDRDSNPNRRDQNPQSYH